MKIMIYSKKGSISTDSRESRLELQPESDLSNVRLSFRSIDR